MNSYRAEGITELVTCAGGKKRGLAMGDVGAIQDGAFVVENGLIRAVGTRRQIAGQFPDFPVVNFGNRLVTPGYVDSHTHLVFAGERSQEFSWRLRGDSYMSIMKRGGGIVSTVDAVRAASEEELVSAALPHLANMLKFGVTTCEVKSGYGLDVSTELKQLRVARRLNDIQPVEIIPTFMGAHSVPRGQDAERYIDFCIEESLPAAAESGLAVFADIFCEKGVFSLAQSERYLRRAAQLGFGLKVHADEMYSLGGAGLAVKLGAVSADHLLKVREEDIARLAASETVATVLPLTAFSLAEPYAPARRLIDGGAAVSVASDFNPGSCCTYSVPLAVALCCIHMKMSIEETLTALTVNGAAACGCADRLGSIEAGKQADFLVYSCRSKEFLPYCTGLNLVEKVYKQGELVHG